MFVYLRLRKVSHFFVNNLRLIAQIVQRLIYSGWIKTTKIA